MTLLPEAVQRRIMAEEPLLWINPAWASIVDNRPAGGLGIADIEDAALRLERFAPLLAMLFPELRDSGGLIESALLPAGKLRAALVGENQAGQWFLKADHDLPIAGSIKARGGIYEVLVHAEALALHYGIISGSGDDYRALRSRAARAHFARHRVVVGSTGNLGLSIGIMAAALGFSATVHMSWDAKDWKKRRLRDCGVTVVEHQGAYEAAVAKGRIEALADPYAYFVDDENSLNLFLGYSVAALRVRRQLEAHGVVVDAEHPLFVYLPCGVGGAPGGITFGLRHIFGDDVHCFFAEPVAAPAMLVRLAAIEDRPIPVSALGLDTRTEADGLAVGTASELAAAVMRPLLSGVFTVDDDTLVIDLRTAWVTEGVKIEPSAAAAMRGPQWLVTSDPGRDYCRTHALNDVLRDATHILWTTGGSFMPDDEFRHFLAPSNKERS